MQGFELEILNWIQAHLRCGVLDAAMPAVSWICNHGEVWILPIFCITKHRGGVWLYYCRRAEVFSALTPSPYGHSPYISLETPRNATGHDRERG